MVITGKYRLMEIEAIAFGRYRARGYLSEQLESHFKPANVAVARGDLYNEG